MDAGTFIPGENILLNRIPVMSRKQTVSAYRVDLVVPEPGEGLATPRSVPLTPPLATVLDDIDPSRLLGNRDAIFVADTRGWHSISMSERWRKKAILEVPMEAFLESNGEAGDQWEADGPALCLTGFDPVRQQLPARPSYPLFVMLDASEGEEALAHKVSALKDLRAMTIASNVDTRDDFDLCSRAGIDLFQGDFYTKPTLSSRKSVSPNQALLLELAAQTGRNGDIRAIEAIFKKNPDLAFGLMNLIHTAFFGVPEHVATIRQAVALLGYDNLHKWVSLMLFTIGQSDAVTNPLFEKALIRARTMELAASHLRDKGLTGSAYIVGVFSLIPALFNVGFEDILEKANFVDDIKRALLTRSGTLGSMLTSLDRIEKGDYASRHDEGAPGPTVIDLLRARDTALMEQSAEYFGVGQAVRIETATRPEHGRVAKSFGAVLTPKTRRSWITRLLIALGIRSRGGSVA